MRPKHHRVRTTLAQPSRLDTMYELEGALTRMFSNLRVDDYDELKEHQETVMGLLSRLKLQEALTREPREQENAPLNTHFTPRVAQAFETPVKAMVPVKPISKREQPARVTQTTVKTVRQSTGKKRAIKEVAKQCQSPCTLKRRFFEDF